MQRTHWLIALFVASGCALESPEQPVTSAHEPGVVASERGAAGAGAVEATAQAIRNGTAVTQGKRGVVEVCTDNRCCTGALIGTRHLITAARCVVGQFDNGVTSGVVAASVRYFKPGGTKPYISDSNDNGTGDSGFENLHGEIVRWAVFPAPGEDIALLNRTTAPWVGTTDNDYLPLSVAASCRMFTYSELFGRGVSAFAGTGAGVLRKTTIHVNQCNGTDFYSLAGGAQTCTGDEGGPYIVTSGGLPILVGLHSDQQDEGRHCTEGGGRQYALRIASRVSWIEEKMGVSLPTHTTAEGHQYKRFWF